MDYNELLQKRRSIRNFADKKISLQVIEQMLQEACLAPSASNTQPWKFVIIQDKDIIKKISDESKRCALDFMQKHPESPYCKYKNVLSNPDYNIFYNAPALIFVVGEDNYPFFREDCTSAVNYLMFAAVERGLGTCWIGHAHSLEGKPLTQEIGIPKNHKIAAVIALGYPQSIPKNYERKGLFILKTIGDFA